MDVRKIAVIGAGAMGSGIAQVCARAGYQVLLYDIEPRMLESAREDIARFVRRGVDKNEYSAEVAESIIARVRATTSLADAVGDADLVIEAVYESMDVKKSLYVEMARLAPERTIFASNTSSLSISEMGAASQRAHKFVGMHFFNPAPLMRLVEVIRGAESSEDTVDTVLSVARSLHKTPVVAQDSPNFIVNRVSRPWYYEAELLVMEGALAQNVDAAIRQGAGMPMGPLELMDMAGLAMHLASSETALKEWGDPKWRPVPLVRKLVRSGHVGRRAGKGFYLYPDGVQTPRTPTPTYDVEPYEIKRVAIVGRGYAAQHFEERLSIADYSVARYGDLNAASKDLGGVQMVIEAFEGTDPGPAVELFKAAATACPPSTLFVTTSSLFSPGELGALCGRPEQTIALHEPFPFMTRNFVEVGKGMDAADRSVATAIDVARRLGYSWVVMDETPCYYVHRIIVPMINEAAFALFEGLASAEDIDTAMKLGMNHPLGPLEWADRLGVDVVLNVMDTLLRDFGDPRYRPCIRIKQMVRAGHLGVKTGRGFYRY